MNRALILFTKVPRPGFVKTRLTKGFNALSEQEACELYSCVLRDTLDAIRLFLQTMRVDLYVSYTPEDRLDELREIVVGFPKETRFIPQTDETMAGRLNHVFETVFKAGVEHAVLIAGDHPDMDPDVIGKAFRFLGSGEAGTVLGPTYDGGVYLIGTTQRSWKPFSGEFVDRYKILVRLTLRAAASGAEYRILDEKMDLDDASDLRYFVVMKQGLSGRTKGFLEDLSRVPVATGHPEISVIVATVNEEKLVGSSLKVLRRQSFSDFEVVVVDGGSEDGTVAEAAHHADRVVILNRKGRQHQENVGAIGAKGDILLFLHADASMHRDTLRRVHERVRMENVIGGGCILFYRSAKFRYRVLEGLRHLSARALGIYGINGFFARRDVFFAIGMFDEDRLEEAVAASPRIRRLGRTVRLNLPIVASPRRFEKRGFVQTTVLWAVTVFASFLGLRAAGLEELLWPEER